MADLKLQQIKKAFGDHIVLDRFDLHIRSGECFTIIGPSGCGKTIILRLIAGFETPDAGEVFIGDTKVADAHHALAPEERKIGVVFQDYAVWPHKTVYGNVAYPLEIAGLTKSDIAKQVHNALALVNLDGYEMRFPYQLSGGQQQRVALARALVMRPEILLLDEPLTNLDANLREEMRFEIKEIQKATGATILYVTHDQEVAMALSDRLAIMDEAGRIHQIDTPEIIYTHPIDIFVFKFLGISNIISIKVSEHFASVKIKDKTVELPFVAPSSMEGKEGTLGFRPMDVQIERKGNSADFPAIATRVTILGPIVDYLFDFQGIPIRAQALTDDALAADLILEPGEKVFLSVLEPKWFNSEGVAQQ
ncbi:MAG TPA: ABC transporter ATP-binding protein [Rectinema sp.]|nr:ABC transporter ATP-binding protein [Rectinema sp.]